MSFSTNCTNLFTLAHTKLRSSFRGENWRRVVLHKTVLHSPTQSTSFVVEQTRTDAYHDNDHFDEGESPEDVLSTAPDVVHDYLFPDAGNFVEYSPAGSRSSEAQWLDSLLESLGDDDDDYFASPSSPPPTSTTTTTVTSTAVVNQKCKHDDDEEDEQLFSPSASPLSSSDDLTVLSHNHHSYYTSSSSSLTSSSSSSFVQYPYISPYPPFHPHAFVQVSPFDLPAPYEDPLPFSDDVDDMPVPDAIEDTSDDESDTPPTPSIAGSRASLCSVLDVDPEVVDAVAIPLPPNRSGLRHALSTLRGYDPLDDVCLYSYHPFSSDAISSYNLYSEC